MIRFLLTIIFIFLLAGAVGSYFDMFRADGYRYLLKAEGEKRAEHVFFSMQQIDSISAVRNFHFTVNNALIKTSRMQIQEF